MHINLKIKAISLPILAGLIMSAVLLWPAQVLADGPFCSGPGLNLAIPESPDRDVPGDIVTDTLTVSDMTLINDLNVSISTTHPYVGDLVFTLTHTVGPVITPTVIISRPLRGTSVITGEVACSGDNIDVTLDDEATLDIQIDCAEGTTHGDGTQAYTVGQSYKPYNPLSIFENDSISGTWELSITDNYQDDVGFLEGWCLIPNQQVDLAISKTDGGITASPSGLITYTLTYSNSGDLGAGGVVITETLPANTSFNAAGSPGWAQVGATNEYTYDVGALSPGASQNITFTVSVTNPLPAGVTTIFNTAQIGDDGNNGVDPDLSDNTSSDTTPVSAAPNLAITKTDGGITVPAGGLITYTLTYSNSGNQNATGVTITETLPANTSFNAAGSPGWQQVGATNQYTYNVGDLGVGPGQTVTFAVTVNNPLPAEVTTITNTAQTGDDGNNGSDPNSLNNTVSETTPIVPPGFNTFLPVVRKNN